MAAARQRPLARQLRGRCRSGAIATRSRLGRPVPVVAPRLRAARRRRRHARRRARRRRADRAGGRARAAARDARAARRRGRDACARDRATPTRCERARASTRSSQALADALSGPRASRCTYPVELPLVVDRERARFSHLVRAVPALGLARARARTARFATARRGCRTSPRWASTCSTCRRSIRSAATNRKGTNNALDAAPGRRRQPVGDRRGARAATRRCIRSSARSRTSGAWSRAAREHGIEIALDIAFQCAPDHPYVQEHPQWFRRRPDGTRPVRREPAEEVPGHLPVRLRVRRTGAALWQELKSVFDFWIGAGRADLPRRQPAHQGVRVLGMGDRAR